MRILRKKFLARSLSILFLLIFLESTFVTNYSWALTTGPHQPEYISYEEPGATDMVNLLTGDFNLSLPALEVPGPEGSFSLPLTYNAGIGTDQEASWVGLGWTMNAGAITRTINEFPDDANGESHSITKQDLTGLRGWTSAALGFGQLGWNTIDGHYGAISLFGLDISYDNQGLSSVGIPIAGVSVNRSGFQLNPVALAVNVMMIAATAGLGELAGAALGKAGATGMDILQYGATLSSLNFSSSTPSAPTAGTWQYSRLIKQKFLHKDYWIWLDQTRTEKMFGTLYAGNAQSSNYTIPNSFLTINGTGTLFTAYPLSGAAGNEGSASDINQYINPGDEYYQTDNPVALATDNYSVKGYGISGSIKPYRLEVGSVAMPREMSTDHVRLLSTPYLNNYKVPFLYEGNPSGGYFYHSGGSSTVSAPSFYYGGSYANGGSLSMSLNDIAFGTNTRIGGTATTTNHVPMNNHVEWMSNAEILDETKRANVGFMDFLTAADRANFRDHFNFGYQSQTYSVSVLAFSPSSSLVDFQVDPSQFAVGDVVDINMSYSPQGGSGNLSYVSFTGQAVYAKSASTITFNSSAIAALSASTEIYAQLILKKQKVSPQAIGGYAITAANGLTYHYALPVFDYEQHTEIIDINDANKKTKMDRVGAFANTWLLTAITGPDFIDRSAGGAANGIVDDSDWGYWVKLNYGKAADDFQWRLPYAGYKNDKDNTVNMFTSGKKQLYYLNTIETRSHVALFVKDYRLDSRPAVTGTSSMKLNEICLLKKDDYKKLVAPVGQGGYGLQDYSYGISNLSTSLSGGVQTFVYQQAIKRIGFTYTYDLCPGTLNSAAGGKLTLTRLSTYGHNSAKVTPDYLFEYGFNPAYNANAWDGWGAYASLASVTNHRASESGPDGSAWSLTKITNPLGSTTFINYERDTYGSISGQYAYEGARSFSSVLNQTPETGFTTILLPGSDLAVNDIALVEGTWSVSCPDGYVGNFSQVTTVTAVSGNNVTFSNTMGVIPNCTGTSNSINYTGTVKRAMRNLAGGNIRVGSIILTDNGKQVKTRYLYLGEDGTNTSGVVSQEPEYIKNTDYDFYNLPGFPQTPVMYGKVMVLNGALTTDTDYHTKTVYRFETPDVSQFVYTRSAVADRAPVVPGILTMSHHKLENYTARIGKLNSIEVWDNTSLKSSTIMSYISQPLNAGVNNYQGVFSGSNLISEKVHKNNVDYLRISRTTELTYPAVLSKVTKTANGFVSESENLNWDMLSGAVLEKIERSTLGINIKTVTIPAYKTWNGFLDMGSKAVDLTYKNMLSQPGAVYTYKTDASGSTILGLVSASAQTWRKDWSNYRVLNSGVYSEQAEGPNIWRKSAAYIYKGNYGARLTDGTQSFNQINSFNFLSPGSNPLWQYTGETKRYDHFSMPLESIDLNNISTSVKMGYGDQVKIAEAGNAAYTEMTFSGAEDLNASTGFFGGEVALVSPGGTASISSTAHTGGSSLSLASGYGFVYKPTGLKINRTYRASVWTNSTNGRIYYILNGVEQVSPAPTASVNGWYIIDFQIPLGSTTTLETGVKSLSGTVLFDDFRFQPIDAGMTTYVYDPSSGQLTHVLDNDNLYTKYEYNDRGLLIKTYRESIKFNGVRLVSESRDNYKRFYTNQ